MSDIVTPILETLNRHPELGGIITFLISAGESIAILGTLVPGSITMTFIGSLAGAGILPLWSTLIWAILGAIVGDGVSYWIGHHFKDRLRLIWPFKHHPNLLKSGEYFFHKHGSMSVFIGRFVGPVRALVPLIAGMLGMRPLMFYIANIASAILWAPAYMLPGILLGAAALELPPDIALHVIMAFIFVVLIVLLVLWFIYKIFQLIQNQTDQLKNHIWYKLENSSYYTLVTLILKHHDPKKTHSQLRLALFFILISVVFLGLASLVKFYGATSIGVNDAIYHLFRGIREPNVDNFMFYLTLLGQKQVVLPTLFILFGYLMLTKRFWTALHVLLVAFLGAGSVYVIKHIVQSHRPWGIAQLSESFSFPSGHTTLATLAFMGLACLLAASFNPRRRFPLYLIAMLVAIAVGISRLYLGAHWFTDVLGGWILSAAILILVIISFRRREERLINPFGTFIVSIVALAASVTTYHYLHSPQMKIAYAQIEAPRPVLSKKEWWNKDGDKPARVSLFGIPTQYINVEWAGDLQKIQSSLLSQGWSNPPERDWISTLHRLADISSSQYLPMVSPQYLDKNPTLILTREFTNTKNEKRLLVLRLWDAYQTIEGNKQTVWVGIVSIVPRTYSWIYNKHPEDIDVSSKIIFPKNSKQSAWEMKLVNLPVPNKKNLPITQDILLIRDSQSVKK